MDPQSTSAPGLIVPAIDLNDSEDYLTVNAEIPGVSEDDLNVTLNGDLLRLSGEKRDSRDESKDGQHLIERSFGRFNRQIRLGFTPERDAVDATFKDGVLEFVITKPKEARSETQTVEIKRG